MADKTLSEILEEDLMRMGASRSPRENWAVDTINDLRASIVALHKRIDELEQKADKPARVRRGEVKKP